MANFNIKNKVPKPIFKGLLHFIVLLIFCGLAFQATAKPSGSAKKVLKLMGCRFEITAIANNDTIAWKAVNAGIHEIRRIEDMISSWKDSSQTSLINKNAGIQPVKIDKELFDLIYRAKKVSALTGGAFDISFASMDNIWTFDRGEHPLPDSSVVADARSKIGYRKILLNAEDTTVFLTEQGMKIGFGAIGKGYAANRAKKIMSQIPGVTGGVVNASGDLFTWGESISPDGWTVKIADPKDKAKPIGWLRIDDMAIVTSGDYEKYFTCNGQRYCHIINPVTGYPTQGIASATIICPDAELADALATSVIVLGKDNGIALIDKLEGIECIVIMEDGSIYKSKNLKLNYY